MLAFSFITVPVVLNTTTDAAQLYRQWLRTYYAGFPVLPTISIGTGSLFLLTAIRNRLEKKPWITAAAAGLTTILMVPFTWIFLVPTNNYLMKLEADATAGSPASIEQAQALVKFWSGRHMMRSFFPLIGAAIGLSGLLNQA